MAVAMSVTGICATPLIAQQAPLISTCGTGGAAPACTASRGDRAEGWAAQSRAEVMAQHGRVTSSQPRGAMPLAFSA